MTATTNGIQYRMTRKMADGLLAKRKATDKKLSTNDYLCKVVNESFGLMGNCVRVIIS